MGALVVIIYLAFVSLGLPDAVLGAAWPAMYSDLGADSAGAGLISILMLSATIVVSFASGWLLKVFGTYKVCAMSVALTAVSLIGFSWAPNFWWLALLSIPLGLGGGAIDAALNSYAALYFSARSMNLLHASWGVGASIGPLMVSATLGFWGDWRPAYALLALIQAAICALLVVTRKLWDTTPPRADGGDDEPEEESAGEMAGAGSVTRKRVYPELAASVPWYKLPGIWPGLFAFLCYCSLELSTGLWAATFLVEHHGVSPEVAAAGAASFYAGVTGGRFAAAFMTSWLNNTQLLIGGAVVLVAGSAIALFWGSPVGAVLGFGIVGLGCAPIYPATIKETPRRYGAHNTQRLMGLQMGFAYSGQLVVPPLVGLLVTRVEPVLMPTIVFVLAGILVFCVMRVEAIIRSRENQQASTPSVG